MVKAATGPWDSDESVNYWVLHDMGTSLVVTQNGCLNKENIADTKNITGEFIDQMQAWPRTPTWKCELTQRLLAKFFSFLQLVKLPTQSMFVQLLPRFGRMT